MSELDTILTIIYSYAGNRQRRYKKWKLYFQLKKIKADIQRRQNIINALKNKIGNFEIVDWTDARSGNCYEFKILLHRGQNILDDDIELINILGGKRRDLRLFISLITNYYYYFVEETRYDKKNKRWLFATVTQEDDVIITEVKNEVESTMIDLGYKKLSDEIANMVIPDIETEFIEKGNVKVFNCLFTDIVKL